MPLVEEGSDIICATCPRIAMKARKTARLKNFELKENLTKLHFISSESASVSECEGVVVPRSSEMPGVLLVRDNPSCSSDYTYVVETTNTKPLYNDSCVNDIVVGIKYVESLGNALESEEETNYKPPGESDVAIQEHDNHSYVSIESDAILPCTLGSVEETDYKPPVESYVAIQEHDDHSYVPIESDVDLPSNEESNISCEEASIESLDVPCIVGRQGRDETKQTSNYIIQDQVAERFRKQMDSYLSISSSYEKSIGLTYNSSEEDSISVEDNIPEEPVLDSLVNGKLIEAPYSTYGETIVANRKEETCIPILQPVELKQVGVANEMVTNTRCETSIQMMMSLDNEIHTDLIINELQTPDLRQTIEIREPTVCVGITENGNMVASPLLHFFPEIGRRPTPVHTMDPFENENLTHTAYLDKNPIKQQSNPMPWNSNTSEAYNSQPLLTMSFSTPGMEQHEFDLMQRRECSNDISTACNEVAPFKDTTNAKSRINNPTSHRSRMRPSPELVGYPINFQTRRTSNKRIAKEELDAPLKTKNTHEERMETHHDGCENTRVDEDHCRGLFDQFHSVVSRTSAMGEISIKQSMKNATICDTTDDQQIVHDRPSKAFTSDFHRMLAETKRCVGIREDENGIGLEMTKIVDRLCRVSLAMKELDESIEKSKLRGIIH